MKGFKTFGKELLLTFSPALIALVSELQQQIAAGGTDIHWRPIVLLALAQVGMVLARFAKPPGAP